MTELVSFAIGTVFMVGIGYAGYLGGRDAAERRASATIATLRRSQITLRRQRDELLTRNAELARIVYLRKPNDTEPPAWMN